MAEMIRKLIDTEIKDIGERALQFIGSTESADRDGEVILASGWDLKNYKKNPVFLWAHNYTMPPIGKATKVRVKDGQLLFDVEFAPRETYEFADTIYKLYKGGFIHATSVGFVPVEFVDGDSEKTPKRTFLKQELLELSGCPVPSNPDALRLACDSGLVTIKQLKDMGIDFGEAPQTTTTEPPEQKIQPISITPHIPTQGEVRDEIDYLMAMLGKVEMDDKTQAQALQLAYQIDSIVCIKAIPTITESVTTPEVIKVELAPQETFDYNALVDRARRVGEDKATKLKG